MLSYPTASEFIQAIHNEQPEFLRRGERTPVTFREQPENIMKMTKATSGLRSKYKATHECQRLINIWREIPLIYSVPSIFSFQPEAGKLGHMKRPSVINQPVSFSRCRRNYHNMPRIQYNNVFQCRFMSTTPGL